MPSNTIIFSCPVRVFMTCQFNFFWISFINPELYSLSPFPVWHLMDLLGWIKLSHKSFFFFLFFSLNFCQKFSIKFRSSVLSGHLWIFSALCRRNDNPSCTEQKGLILINPFCSVTKSINVLKKKS